MCEVAQDGFFCERRDLKKRVGKDLNRTPALILSDMFVFSCESSAG